MRELRFDSELNYFPGISVPNQSTSFTDYPVKSKFGEKDYFCPVNSYYDVASTTCKAVDPSTLTPKCEDAYDETKCYKCEDGTAMHKRTYYCGGRNPERTTFFDRDVVESRFAEPPSRNCAKEVDTDFCDDSGSYCDTSPGADNLGKVPDVCKGCKMPEF